MTKTYGEYIFPTGRISLCASLSYTSDTLLIGSHCLYPYSPGNIKPRVRLRIIPVLN